MNDCGLQLLSLVHICPLLLSLCVCACVCSPHTNHTHKLSLSTVLLSLSLAGNHTPSKDLHTHTHTNVKMEKVNGERDTAYRVQLKSTILSLKTSVRKDCRKFAQILFFLENSWCEISSEFSSSGSSRDEPRFSWKFRVSER